MSNPPARAPWWRLALCGALLAAGCSTVANPASCADGFCHDPAFPFCDVDGTIGGGSRLTCIAVACTPHAFAACRGDEAIVCNATGDDYDVTHCEGGCSAEAAGCKPTHIIPRYLPTVCDQPATEPELTISESTTLDTSDDASCNGGIVDQVHGPDICVLRYGQITIERNKTLAVTGSRALALVADRALTIDGILDVSADRHKDGPGGGIILSGRGGALSSGGGGGGAGFRTVGAPGGTNTEDGGGNNGGGSSEDPALSVELTGGTRADGNSETQISGGGGGAVTLISCRSRVSLFGVIDAGGGGGAGALVTDLFALVASGGGSGGNVVFQGMAVTITGQAFANGGAGGAGSYERGIVGALGEDGSRSDITPARGGVNPDGGGTGGNGGVGGDAPAPGRKAGNNTSPGAGGGSTGFLQTYTPAGVMPTLTPAAASPPFQPNRTVETR